MDIIINDVYISLYNSWYSRPVLNVLNWEKNMIAK